MPRTLFSGATMSPPLVVSCLDIEGITDATMGSGLAGYTAASSFSAFASPFLVFVPEEDNILLFFYGGSEGGC